MLPSIDWQWKRLADLTPVELYAALAARSEVFVVEQHCAFLDADGLDDMALHLLGWAPADGPAKQAPTLAAYLRLIEPGRKYEEPSIGRVLTRSAFRGVGLGRVLMREGLSHAAAIYPGRAIRIGAQRYLEHFYASVGFRPASEPYLEDGIEHIEMLRPVDQR